MDVMLKRMLEPCFEAMKKDLDEELAQDEQEREEKEFVAEYLNDRL
jgi:hypothetical protein